MEKTYTINELAMMTGLTTRTLRNYLNLKLLNGNKSDGAWQFTETQISDFVSNPAVLPSIQAKNKAIAFDFLSKQDKKENEICTMIDLHHSKKESEQTCTLCMKIINETEYKNIRFSYEYHQETTRIILSGPQKFVTDLLNQIEKL